MQESFDTQYSHCARPLRLKMLTNEPWLRRIVRRWHCSIFQQKRNKLKHNVAQRFGKSQWEEERQTTGTHILTSRAPASGKDWDEPLTRVCFISASDKLIQTSCWLCYNTNNNLAPGETRCSTDSQHPGRWFFKSMISVARMQAAVQWLVLRQHISRDDYHGGEKLKLDIISMKMKFRFFKVF